MGAIAGVLALALAACSGGSTSSQSASSDLDPGDWASVLAQAKGQTVNWHMYGGDSVLNTFVTGYVADRMKEADVTLKQVKIVDTVDAVNAVLGEKQAGRDSAGSVDAIWINGENFATGRQAELWDCGWPQLLPNAKYVDFADPAVASDFGVPVDGCEAVWQQSNSALVYDSARLDSADVVSVSSLFAWAESNPGQFAYPALPDFTGSMAVRSILYDTIGGPAALAGPFDASAYAPRAEQLWERLNSIEPSLWRGGDTYPASQEAVEKLYSDGEISAFFTYGPGAVGPKVDQGLFPETTREAVLAGGNIANNSFLAIPYNASHKAGALVLANILQDPQTQLALYRAQGVYPGVDLAKVDADTRAEFAAVPVSASVLPLAVLTRDVQPELDSAYITRIEADWKVNVLQK